jgi:hypothetical protein
MKTFHVVDTLTVPRGSDLRLGSEIRALMGDVGTHHFSNEV